MKKITITLMAVILTLSFSHAIKAETNCPECLAKRVQALEAGQAEILETLKAIQDRLDQTPPAPPVEQVACNKLSAEQRTTINQVCVTSKGAKFTRVAMEGFGEAWMGPTGKNGKQQIWSDLIGSADQYNAIENCKAIEGSLPSKMDFIRGEARGIREVLPNMKDRWFWSSSVRPIFSYYAYAFDGYSGGFYVDYPSSFNGSVRCVVGR